MEDLCLARPKEISTMINVTQANHDLTKRLPGTPPNLSARHANFLGRHLSENGLTYLEYLESDHWKALKNRYRNSGLPQQCLICHDRNVDLHHRTYKRVGHEK